MAQGIGLELKRLRESAVPKLSIRVIAEKLCMVPSSYAYYEDSFKGARLPINLVEKLLPILTSHGILSESVISLSGAPDIVNAPANIDALLLALCIRAINEILAEGSIDLPISNQAEMAADLYVARVNAPDADIKASAYPLVVRYLSNAHKQQGHP